MATLRSLEWGGRAGGRGGARLGRGVPGGRRRRGARPTWRPDGRPASVRRAHPRRRCWRRPRCTARSGSATTSCGPRSRPTSASRAGLAMLTEENWFEVMGDRPTTALWGIGSQDRARSWPRSASTPSTSSPAPTPGCWPPSSGRRWGRGTTGSAAASATARSTPSPGCRARTAARRRSRPTSRTGTQIAEEVRTLTRRVRRGHRPRGPAGGPGRAQAALPAVHHGQPQPHPARSPPTTRTRLAEAAVSLLDRVEHDRPVRLLGVRLEMVEPEGGY